MNPNLNLNWLRTFEAASRHLSFTAASRELGLTQTAVSLQIKSLETKLGQELFIRRARSLKLTEIGKAYLPSVRDSLDALKLSTSGLFGPDQTSTVVVRASMALIVWLTPKIASFQRDNPGVGIKFVTALWTDAIDTQNVDVDIVLGPDKRAEKQLEKLSDEFLVPVCSRNRNGTIHSAADLLDVPPIHILGFDDHWARYLSAFDLQYDVRLTRLQVDTFVAACEMVACDLGCAIVLERFARNAIESGKPVVLAGEPVALSQSHYLLNRDPTSATQPATEAVREWLRQCFKHHNPV